MSKTSESNSKSDKQLNRNESFINNPNNEVTNAMISTNRRTDCDEKAINSLQTNLGQTVSNNSVKRKLRSLTFGRRKKSLTCSSNKCKNICNNTDSNTCNSNSGKKKKSSSGWAFKLCARTDSTPDVTQNDNTCSSCICTAYKKTDEQLNESDLTFISQTNSNENDCNNDNTDDNNERFNQIEMGSNLGLNSILFSPQEANELITNSDSLNEAYVDSSLVSEGMSGVNNGFTYNSSTLAVNQNIMSEVRSVQVRVSELALALRSQLALTVSPYPYLARWGEVAELTPGFLNRFCLRSDSSSALNDGQQIHTQIDYIHCLVPDLLQITNCSFYWGKMDRYEAERLLENKPEGTFLLRDSAQEEHLFSVSFRRFDRSLHARIEQWNHRFSFDSHDPGVYASNTVCGLIEHYKDPSHCMFFEPMLTIPLHRNFPFSLQHLSRATISSRVSYDTIQSIQLPKRLKNYLKEYHYKQQVRVRRLDSDH